MIYDPRPVFDPLVGIRGWGRRSLKIQLCQNTVMLHIKENNECSNMVANILPAESPPPNLGLGSIGQNSTFSEHPHYPRGSGQKVKIHLFRTWSCWISNLLESRNVANILPAAPLLLRLGSKGQYFTFRTWSCCTSNLLESRNI